MDLFAEAASALGSAETSGQQGVAQAQAAAADERSKVLEGQVLDLTSKLHALEATLAQRTEELDESRRLHASQKRALRQALAAAEERESQQHEAASAGRQGLTLVLEAEVESLTQQLASLQVRSYTALQHKEGEVRALQQRLAAAEGEAAAAAAAAATAAEQRAAAAAEAAARAWEAQVAQLREEAGRLRAQLREEAGRQWGSGGGQEAATELALAQKEGARIQKELEAFRDLANQAAISHRREVARLLDENVQLKARIASDAANIAMGLQRAGRTMFTKTFSAWSKQQGGLGDQLLGRLEEPAGRALLAGLVTGAVLLLLVVLAVARSAAAGDWRPCWLGGACGGQAAQAAVPAAAAAAGR